MEASNRKHILRDNDGNVKITNAVHPGMIRGFKSPIPAEEFAKVDTRSLVFPAYKELASIHGPILGMDDLNFAPPDLNLEDGETRHKAVDGEDICECCEDIDIGKMFKRLAGKRFQLGDAKAVLECTCCALCRLLTASFELGSGKSAAQLIDSFPFAAVILTSTYATYPVSRQWEREEITAYLFDETTTAVAAEGLIRLHVDDANKVRMPQDFKGRVVLPEGWNADLARTWLKECDDDHDCIRQDHGDDTDSSYSMIETDKEHEEKLLLIDVQRWCLAEASASCGYTTLSYVWPRFEALQLKKDNLAELKIPGALLEYEIPLPNVLQNAIEVVRALGERYLWIDALCIVQDDKELKDKLIQKMDRIYGDSYLNIVVASASSPVQDYCIPGVAAPRVSCRQVVEEVQDIRLITALPNYNDALESTVWTTRGWTFQEGILSKRCLVFTEHQMYFRCAEDSRCEDVAAEHIPHSHHIHPARPKQRQSKIDYLANSSFLKSLVDKDTFGEYVLLVREYSQRSSNLTFKHDILPAFTGILNALSPHFKNGGFFWGLSAFSFERSLLWYPTSSLKRRSPLELQYGQLPYPTWSWAGWIGSVDYEEDTRHDGDSNSQYSATWWYRYDIPQNSIVPVRPNAFAAGDGPCTGFALGILWEKHALLANNPQYVISWVGAVKMKLQLPETYILEWLTDHDQSVPCFTIIDDEGRACGFLPSTDRDWARRYNGGECELLILSHASQGRFDEAYPRRQFFHLERYQVDGQMICFFNVMLVEYDEDGIARRMGCGRVHKAAIGAEDVARLDFKVVVLG